MPSGRARDLYSAHAAYRNVIRKHSNRILTIMSDVIRSEGIRGSIVNRQDNEEKFDLLQECNDMLLEKINSNIDDLSGVKNPDTVVVQAALFPEAKKLLNGSWNKTIEKSASVQSARLLTARNIHRPQASFKTPIDNSNNPFYPRIRYKPNSIRPLAVLPEYNDEGEVISYLHPYEMELEKFEPPETVLIVKAPIPSTKIESADLDYIDTVAGLKAALAEFEQVTELAVDVEHHSYRTFQGITCLLQVSTRTKDYIFDTIALREELHLLNEVFTKPTIVKVFHGAGLDIQWLQRDLSIYVVNMFDTFEAAKRLGFARLSLAYLLKHYCGIDADKTFQLADWRMRPLLEELIEYARQDTHYLLYIYDNLRNDLIKLGNGNTNILKSVYQASTDVCKQKYIKPTIGPNSYLDIYRKSKKVFDNRQLFALKQIFVWRDKTAREEDESYGYVLPNHMMLQIAETLPREMQGILACCNPIPPLVKQHLTTLHQFILRAREQSLEKAVTVEETPVDRESQISNFRDHDNPLYCLHDLGKEEETTQLPCLLTDPTTLVDSIKSMINVAEPQLKIFLTNDLSKDVAQAKDTSNLPAFITPFQRYKVYLPRAMAQRQKEEEEKSNIVKQLCPEKPVESQKHKLDDDTIEIDDEEAADVALDPFRQTKKRRLGEPVATKYSIQIFSGPNGEAEVDQHQYELEKTIDELSRSRQQTNSNNKVTPQNGQPKGPKPNLTKKQLKMLRRKEQMKDKSAKKLHQEMKR